MLRLDGRGSDEIRPLKITRNVNKYAEGSCIIEMGDTHVLCTATVEDKVPLFLKNSGQGWVTAEYGMLPRSCDTRSQRDINKGRANGRSMEIQRLIGRSIRSVVDMHAFGERTVILDCDVLQADGGTRTASITGAFCAFMDACAYLREKKILSKKPYSDIVAAISVGIVINEELLDLNYKEDSEAAADMNVVMTSAGRIIEVQCTAEGAPFTRSRFDKLVDLAASGIGKVTEEVKKTMADVI